MDRGSSQHRSVSILKKDPFNSPKTNDEAPEFLSPTKSVNFTKCRKPVRDIIFQFEKFFVMAVDITCYYDKFSTKLGFGNEEAPGEIFRIFGCNDFGNSICMHIHGYRPKLSVVCPVELNSEREIELLEAFREEVKQRHYVIKEEGDRDRQKGPCVFNHSSIIDVKIREGMNIYGYKSRNSTESKKMIDITVCCSSAIKSLSSDIRQGLLNGVWRRMGLNLDRLGINQADIGTFNTCIDNISKFMSDAGFTGCGWISVEKGKYRIRDDKECKKVSRCQIEIDCRMDDIISYDPIVNQDKNEKGEELIKTSEDMSLDNINPENFERGRIPPLRVLSFDIECMCLTGFAQPDRLPDKVIQIAIMVKLVNNNALTGIVTDRENMIYQCVLTLGECAPISGVDVICKNDELELLYEFGKLINEIDPDVITGYNIENFDFFYLVTRMTYLKTGKTRDGRLDPNYKIPYNVANDKRKICDFSKLKGKVCVSKVKKFSSNQFGTREMNRTELPGIYVLDIFLVIQVNYKLRSYSLNSVSMTFLKEQKEDVHHSMISKLNDTPTNRRHLAVYCLKDALLPLRLMDKLYVIYNNVEMARVNKIPMDYVSNRGQGVKVLTQIYDFGKACNLFIPDNLGSQSGDRWNNGMDLDDDFEDMDDFNNQNYFGGSERKGKGRKKNYNDDDDDSELVSDEDSDFFDNTANKFEENNSISSNISNSNVSDPVSYRQNSSKEKPNFGMGTIGDNNKGKSSDKVGYKGATVIRPRKGYYDNSQPISVLDFSSLYPSIMIAYNMDYSTWISSIGTIRIDKDNIDYTKLPDNLGKDDINISPTGELFVKPHVKKGIMPEILSKLLRQRSLAKKDMAVATTDVAKKVLNARQLALKVTANSVYGFTGSNVGKLPCFPISSAVTAYGREMIEKTKSFVEMYYDYDKDDNKIIGENLSCDKSLVHAKVVYGDTDSVMIRFGVHTITDAIILGKEAASAVTTLFTKPINLEFEKVYCPFLLLTKKRYAGLLYMNDKKYDKLDMKGIESTRRDNCRLAAELLNRVLECLMIGKMKYDIPGDDMSNNSMEGSPSQSLITNSPSIQSAKLNKNILSAINMTKLAIQNLLQQKIDISYLVISKGYTKAIKEYKVKQPHIELVKKKMARKETVHIGDRIPYVIVSNDTRAASHLEDMEGRKDNEVKLYDRAEDPIYVLEHGYSIDTNYYLESQIKPILSRIFLHLGKNECDTEDRIAGGLNKRDQKNSEWILKEVFEGAHTRSVKIGGRACGKSSKGAPKGIAGFVQEEKTCQICHIPLRNIRPSKMTLEGDETPFYLHEEDTGICVKCLSKGYLPRAAFRAYEKLKSAQYTYSVVNRQCVKCAQSCIGGIDCMSNDCPIYYKRISVLKDIEEAAEECNRFAMWNTELC